MKDQKLLGLGVVGTVVAALSCFTPLLVVLLGAVGLSAIVGWLDYVLVPMMIGSVALIIYAVWRSRTGNGDREAGEREAA